MICETLEMLAQPDRHIGDSDRAQLRAIRQARDVLSSAGSRHDRGLTPEAPGYDGKLVFVAVTGQQAPESRARVR